MKLDIYVNYAGRCEEAFRFYEQHLGGRITEISRHGDVPNPQIPADWKDKVLHARIEIGSSVLMGADVAHAEPMRSAMKMEKTFFANRFAMLRDRFGTSWMLLHQPSSAEG